MVETNHPYKQEVPRALNQLIITFFRSGAAKTQYLAITAYKTVIVDTFAAYIARDALAFEPRHFVWPDCNAHPVLIKKVIVVHLAISAHLLLVLVLNFGIHLARQRL